MGIAIAASLGAVLLILAFLLLGRRRGGGSAGGRGAQPTAGANPANSCPLCSSALGPGERIRSDIFPGKGDRIMRIFGCPRCLPPQGGLARTCPVCGATIALGDWAVARYFERPGRRHVHILGCAACHPAGAGGGRKG